MADLCRALSHSMASSSGFCSAPRALNARLMAAPRPVRVPLRVCSVAGLSRPAASGSSAANSLSNSLNAPSAEELAAPVSTVHSPEEFQDVAAANSGKLIVLMCKATHCRPCKMFARKYAKAAQQYTDAVFLEIIGDESKGTRGMMVDMGIRVTPTFVLFRDGEKIHSHGGINETNLHRNISKFLKEGEAGFGTFKDTEAATADAA